MPSTQPLKTASPSTTYIGLDDPGKASSHMGPLEPRSHNYPLQILCHCYHQHPDPRDCHRLKLILSDKIHSRNSFPTFSVEEQSATILLLLRPIKKRGLNLSEIVCSLNLSEI
ncbi:hypothetical protein PIB30_088442 [Stylosanthes scabra]|uniref:Uncharacterized protein n=1 Tax=Stylosanthes scabra TaxID=79078 RepID=A0ABU6YRB4_9FABA|nr:hypothetical protein [Stylosanthes scabra]